MTMGRGYGSALSLFKIQAIDAGPGVDRERKR